MSSVNKLHPVTLNSPYQNLSTDRVYNYPSSALIDQGQIQMLKLPPYCTSLTCVLHMQIKMVEMLTSGMTFNQQHIILRVHTGYHQNEEAELFIQFKSVAQSKSHEYLVPFPDIAVLVATYS